MRKIYLIRYIWSYSQRKWFLTIQCIYIHHPFIFLLIGWLIIFGETDLLLTTNLMGPCFCGGAIGPHCGLLCIFHHCLVTQNSHFMLFLFKLHKISSFCPTNCTELHCSRTLNLNELNSVLFGTNCSHVCINPPLLGENSTLSSVDVL